MYRFSTTEVRSPLQAHERDRAPRLFLFSALHVPLALLMNAVPMVSTLHVAVTLLLGIFIALSGKKPERVAFMGAYIVGSEVLWRMTEASVYWEIGKYALGLIFLLAILRWRLFRKGGMPMLYLLLLLPAVIMTFIDLDLGDARQYTSFNLSGPFSLMVSVWFFSNMRFSWEDMNKLLRFLIAPTLGILAITLYSTITATALKFTGESNFITSGGFGPNQVSSMLGLVSLLAFLLYIFEQRRSRLLGLTLIGLIILFASESAMTFSRGGVYLAGLSAAAAVFLTLRDARSRMKAATAMTVMFLIANFLLLPYFDTFTEGSFSRRYASTQSSGRDKIAEADLNLWQENLLFGVGIGQAKVLRELSSGESASHTEFTRLLAEHGSLGLLSILMLVFMGLKILKRARDTLGRALSLSLMTWGILFMAVNAMRIVAPGFIFGLAFITVSFDSRSLPVRGHGRFPLPDNAASGPQETVANQRRRKRVTW